jgi:cellulose synthase/poly-beta-1,6-N-acetylglucosamine synthase-like glycosyltransferase
MERERIMQKKKRKKKGQHFHLRPNAIITVPLSLDNTIGPRKINFCFKHRSGRMVFGVSSNQTLHSFFFASAASLSLFFLALASFKFISFFLLSLVLLSEKKEYYYYCRCCGIVGYFIGIKKNKLI